jgi:hypothetical protein
MGFPTSASSSRETCDSYGNFRDVACNVSTHDNASRRVGSCAFL